MSTHLAGRRTPRRTPRLAPTLLGLVSALATGTVLAAPPAASADLAAHTGADLYAIELIQSDQSTGVVGVTGERFAPEVAGLDALERARNDLGYPTATATLSATRGAEGLWIRADVRDGLVPKVASLAFTGNKALTSQQLTDALSAWGNRLRGGTLAVGSRLDAATVDGAIHRVTTTFQDLGYLEVQVKLVVDQADAQAPVGAVTFQIEEGPQFIVSRVEVGLADGSKDPLGFEVPTLRTKPGGPFSLGDLEQDVEWLVLAAAAGGFPQATAERSVSVDKAGHRVAVAFKVNPGSRAAADAAKAGSVGTRNGSVGAAGADTVSAAAASAAPARAAGVEALIAAGRGVALDVTARIPADGLDLPGDDLRAALKRGLAALAKGESAPKPKVVLVPQPGRPWASADEVGTVMPAARFQTDLEAALTEGSTAVATDARLQISARALRARSLPLTGMRPFDVAASVHKMRFGGTAPGATLLTAPDSPLIWFAAASTAAPVAGLEILKGTLDAKGALVLSRHAVLTGSAADEDPQTCAAAPMGAREGFGLWRDAAYDAKKPAVYIARAWLAQTCAPAWRACVRAKGAAACAAQPEPRMLQPRAWTSPIWSGVASP